MNKDAIIAKLLERIDALAAIIHSQAAKIAELEKRLNKDSNSSKPPSSDGVRKPPRRNTQTSSPSRPCGGSRVESMS
ncbi:MAG: DUF6444 domain-containing protein [Legionellales bacterium]